MPVSPTVDKRIFFPCILLTLYIVILFHLCQTDGEYLIVFFCISLMINEMKRILSVSISSLGMMPVAVPLSVFQWSRSPFLCLEVLFVKTCCSNFRPCPYNQSLLTYSANSLPFCIANIWQYYNHKLLK